MLTARQLTNMMLGLEIRQKFFFRNVVAVDPWNRLNQTNEEGILFK